MRIIPIGETRLLQNNVLQMLDHLGAPEWTTDAPSDAEALTEIAGRLCYKSFSVGLNPNITRVRSGNKFYIHNIMSQKHGSVFEHASVNVAFLDVSRILTHELVRHRAGTAYSQESQRFVRLDSFEMYIPDLTDALHSISEILRPEASAVEQIEWVQDMQSKYVGYLDAVGKVAKNGIQELIRQYGLDESGISFHLKKEITSALRRGIPSGVNTHILVSANHRTWRHLIQNRTSPGAEVEIVEAFGILARTLQDLYPALYQDMKESADGCYTFENEKI